MQLKKGKILGPEMSSNMEENKGEKMVNFS